MEKEIDDYRYRWTVTIPVTCSTQLKLVIRSPISDEALLFFALLPFPMSTILCIYVVFSIFSLSNDTHPVTVTTKLE